MKLRLFFGLFAKDQAVVVRIEGLRDVVVGGIVVVQEPVNVVAVTLGQPSK